MQFHKFLLTINFCAPVLLGAGIGQAQALDFSINAGEHEIITGKDATLPVIFDNLIVNGALTLEDGGKFANKYGYVGLTSPGTVVVSGGGSEWKNSNELSVYSGSVTIKDGGSVTSANGYISRRAGDSGSVTVSGPGSKWWANSGELYVGASGRGILTINDGGSVSSSGGQIGVYNDGNGSVTVTGPGSTWTTNSAQLYVGLLGNGELTIAGGGKVLNSDGFIASGGGVGTVTVSGAGSHWQNSGELSIGYNGSGTLTIRDGGVVSATDAHIGVYGSGTLNIGSAATEAATRAGTFQSETLSFGYGRGTLVFNHTNTDYVFSTALKSIVAGSHTINHLAGTTILTGDSSGFLGTTTVSGGKLIVGNADGDGVLGGKVTVRGNGVLGGSGTVGSGTGSSVTVASGGTLAPGNSIGTLAINGNLLMQAGSRFEVEVSPDGTKSDRVEVTGTATLAGGSVIIDAGGHYALRSTNTILSATKLTGSFEDVISRFAFLTPQLLYDYDLGTVDLKLLRNDIDFVSAALTRNQISIANGIESIGIEAEHDVYDAIAQLPDEADLIRASFDALSGEIHASAKSTLIEDSRFIRNAANDRLRAAFNGAGSPESPVLAYGPDATPVFVSPDHAGPVFWSHGFGSWGSTDSDGNAADLDRSIGGFLVGTDGLLGNGRIGLLAGYSHSRFKANDLFSSGSTDSYHLGLYGGTGWGDLSLRSGLAYSWHDLSTNRTVAIPRLSDSLSAKYSAGTFQAFGELGYGIAAGSFRFEPFANLAHVSLDSNGFSETGGAAALKAKANSTDVTFTTLGTRAEHRGALGSIGVTLSGMIGWRHAFGDVTPTSTFMFTGSDTFTIAGAPIASNSAVIEAGLDLNLSREASLGLSYAGQIAADAQDHGIKGQFNLKF